MALIEISETQLAFGYLHSYLNVHRPRRFMLPSIRQEGGMVRFPFPGADIIINDNHLIQFKRPFFFTTNGIKEFSNYDKPTDIDPPYFRLSIKNDNPTNQLRNLVRATQRGLSAEYISPLFSDETTFFRLLRNDTQHLQAYAHIDIAQFSRMLTTIGNNNDHTIIYTVDSVNNGFCYCFSEPKKLTAGKYSNIKDGKEDKHFKASEIIKIILSTFFEKEEISFQSEHPLQQCRVLQQRLLIQKNIIWDFNYKINT
ncbi:MAG: hypothetical protein V4549_15340 [Bacteroidota bacterium]